MKPSELRDKSNEELVELERELRDRLLRARVAVATSRRISSAIFPRTRRTIARIRTILTERERGLQRG